MNENIEYKIKRLLTDFEELEKRIKANKSLLDKSSQTIKNEIEKEVQTLSSEITSCKNLVDEMSTSVEQNTQDISQNTAKITEFSNKITNISTKITQLNEKITQIPTQIEQFSQLINGLTMSDETSFVYEDFGVNEDFIETSCNSNTENANYYSQSYYVACDINQPLEMELELGYDPTIQNMYSSKEYIVEVLLNDKAIMKGQFPCASQSSTNTKKVNTLSSGKIYPENRINEIRIHCTGYTFCTVQYYKLNIKGKNITICGQVPSLSITCFDNKYYIVNKSDYNDYNIYFAELDKDNLTLSTENFQSAKVKETIMNEKLTIYPAFNLSTKQYVSIYNWYCLFPTLENRNKLYNGFSLHSYRKQIEGLTNGHTILYEVEDYDFVYTGKYPCYACFCFVKPNGEPALFCTPDQETKNYVKLKMNGEDLPQVYHKCAVVKNNNLTSQSTTGEYYGSIIWNITTQNWEFYETTDNTYKVILPPGKYCTAYYQTDGSINVYISRGCTTYKYTLVKNTQTSQYELSSTVSTIPKCTKYDELYDGKALIMFYGAYRIYSPNESE